MIEVLRPGALTTVQDLGRPGYAHLGVPLSGACDRPALQAANALVGNRPDAACLETTLAGPTLRAERDLLVSLCGASAPLEIDGEPAPFGQPVAVSAGAMITVGPAQAGLRSYLAVRGGFDLPQTLGSRATDLLSGLGPEPLVAGDRLPIGSDTTSEPGAAAATTRAQDERALAVVLGPRDDRFTAEAIDTALSGAFRVSPSSNRTGVRLEGPALQRRDHNELLSEGMVPGSIQVPPSGQPIVLLADHPTTGGYPVIAVLTAEALAAAGQLRPGTEVMFRPAEPPARAGRQGADPGRPGRPASG